MTDEKIATLKKLNFLTSKNDSLHCWGMDSQVWCEILRWNDNDIPQQSENHGFEAVNESFPSS